MDLILYLSYVNFSVISPKGANILPYTRSSKPCHVGIHWKALEYSQMSTDVPGFQYFFSFFALCCSGEISHEQPKG